MLLKIFSFLIIFIISFIFTYIFVPISKMIGIKFGIFDSVNERKIKKIKLVRIGGIAILLGFLISLISFPFLQFNSKLFVVDYREILVLVCLSFCFFLIEFLMIYFLFLL